jgi:hypothetical protein
MDETNSFSFPKINKSNYTCLGCANSNKFTSKIDSTVAPSSPCGSRIIVAKPIAGLSMDDSSIWMGSLKGKHNLAGVEPAIQPSHPIIDHILPPPQISPVQTSGE